MFATATRLLFQAGSRTIAGSLGGRFLHCMMRPPQGGALPPPGDYEILPPVSDPVYGRLALMTPVEGLVAKDRDKVFKQGLAIGKVGLKPDPTLPAAGKVFPKHYAGAVRDGDVKGGQKPDPIHSAAGGQVFVLSDRPVLGRNCIVVSSGFADLMDALQTAGGARVRVA